MSRVARRATTVVTCTLTRMVHVMYLTPGSAAYLQCNRRYPVAYDGVLRVGFLLTPESTPDCRRCVDPTKPLTPEALRG